MSSASFTVLQLRGIVCTCKSCTSFSCHNRAFILFHVVCEVIGLSPQQERRVMQ
jgi:hypothetical protein